MVGIVIFCAAIMAGLIQTVTGFGSGIFMMLFLPQFFPLLKASALSGSVTLMVNGGVAWKYRKYSQKKYTLLPAVFFIISSSLAIALGKNLPTVLLKKTFGGFLFLLSLYFMFAGQNKKRKASVATAIVCALLSGVLGGFFGISGPPMVIYFLSVLDKKEEYLGTIQLFFFCSGVYMFLLRICSGIYTLDLLRYTVIGMSGVFIGMQMGYKIVDRLDTARLKKIIYFFLAVSGVLNLIG